MNLSLFTGFALAAPFPVFGTSVQISLTFSKTMLQWPSNALALAPKSLRLFSTVDQNLRVRLDARREHAQRTGDKFILLSIRLLHDSDSPALLASPSTIVRSVASPPKPRRMNECRRDSSPSSSSSSSRRANRSIDRRRDSPSRFDRRRRRRVTRRRHPSSPAARDRRVSFPSSWTCESPEVYHRLGVIRPTLWGKPRYSITHSRMRDKPRIEHLSYSNGRISCRSRFPPCPLSAVPSSAGGARRQCARGRRRHRRPRSPNVSVRLERVANRARGGVARRRRRRGRDPTAFG